MATQRKVWAISLPPKMEKEIAQLAKKEEKTKSELIRQALRLYTEARGKGKK
ncbi:CopG family transcriptional regulator [Candidatus Azambacteria bacterium]|nr:CopG family transcriptional regulator [Candidatus Azambacteria bacterium]MBI3684960.1 CopG family transcriptional regulator [Candidatus Azambacteria bacterium]